MFVQDRLIAPAVRPVEFGNEFGAVFAAEFVDTVDIAGQRALKACQPNIKRRFHGA
jgi:hypothetical protein